MKEKTFVCTVCGCEYPISQREEFDDQGLCPHCLEEETVVCRICGERLWRDNIVTSDSLYLNELKSVAPAFGYTPEQIEALAAEGFSPEELEDFLYCGEI